MTYKLIVDNIAEACEQHPIIREFGYGAITDIKTTDKDSGNIDYPYVFLNPTQSSRTGQTITYRFNMIVMDVAQSDPTTNYKDFLVKQSGCQQYIDDILGYLRFKQPELPFDLTLNVNLTPFKERFQDTLAGMTATLEIEVPEPINFCVAPNSPIGDWQQTASISSGDGNHVYSTTETTNLSINPNNFQNPCIAPGHAQSFQHSSPNMQGKQYKWEGTTVATNLVELPANPVMSLIKLINNDTYVSTIQEFDIPTSTLGETWSLPFVSDSFTLTGSESAMIIFGKIGETCLQGGGIPSNPYYAVDYDNTASSEQLYRKV